MTSTDRAAKIDEWVELQALCIVAEGGWAADGSWDGILEIDMFDSPVIRRLRMLLGGELYNELWPTDESTRTDEWRFAHARANLLAIRLFERLQTLHSENVEQLAGVAAADAKQLSSRELISNA
jgi:hypothetical protein